MTIFFFFHAVSKGSLPDGLLGALNLCALPGQLLVQGILLQPALTGVQVQGSTALVVPLKLSIHLLREKYRHGTTGVVEEAQHSTARHSKARHSTALAVPVQLSISWHGMA